MKKISRAVRRMDRRALYAIAFSLMVAVFGCRVQPGFQPGSTAGEGPPPLLRVGTSGDYAPFSIWPPGGSPRGFSISVVQAYAADRGRTIEWVRFRWPDLAARFEANAFDLAISGITVRPDRSMLGRFGLPLTTSGAVVLVTAESAVRLADDLDQPSKRIAVNAGGHLERVARRLFPRARIDPVPDNRKVLDRLVHGSGDRGRARGSETVDAVVTDSLEAPHWQRDWRRQPQGEHEQQTRRPLRAIGPLTRDLKAAWFPRTGEAEARRFDEWILTAEADGRLAELRQRHGLPTVETATPLFALLASLDERLALMPAVAAAKAILEIPIENQSREEVVLDSAVRSVEAAALRAGVEPPEMDEIQRLFRAQIETAKWIQEETLRVRSHDASTPVGDIEREQARIRLEEQIRPALLYLGDRIARLLVECTRSRVENLALEDIERALEERTLPAEQLRELYEALRALLRDDESVARRLKSEPGIG